MTTKFKPGDRVRVYATLNGRVAETCGRITDTREDGMVLVEFNNGNTITAHPKQCRRLVKKERRRVWVDMQRLSAMPTGCISFVAYAESVPGAREFIEVLNKKETA